MTNLKAFPSLDGMQLPVSEPASAPSMALTSQKVFSENFRNQIY